MFNKNTNIIVIIVMGLIPLCEAVSFVEVEEQCEKHFNFDDAYLTEEMLINVDYLEPLKEVLSGDKTLRLTGYTYMSPGFRISGCINFTQYSQKHTTTTPFKTGGSLLQCNEICERLQGYFGLFGLSNNLCYCFSGNNPSDMVNEQYCMSGHGDMDDGGSMVYITLFPVRTQQRTLDDITYASHVQLCKYVWNAVSYFGPCNIQVDGILCAVKASESSANCSFGICLLQNKASGNENANLLCKQKFISASTDEPDIGYYWNHSLHKNSLYLLAGFSYEHFNLQYTDIKCSYLTTHENNVFVLLDNCYSYQSYLCREIVSDAIVVVLLVLFLGLPILIAPIAIITYRRLKAHRVIVSPDESTKMVLESANKKAGNKDSFTVSSIPGQSNVPGHVSDQSGDDTDSGSLSSDHSDRRSVGRSKRDSNICVSGCVPQPDSSLDWVPGRVRQNDLNPDCVPGRDSRDDANPDCVPGRLPQTASNIDCVPGRLPQTASNIDCVPGRVPQSDSNRSKV